MKKKDYSFAIGDLAADYARHFPSSLFNGDTYRKLHAETGWHSCHILDNDERVVKGSVYFFVADGIARSPLRAPFGSVDVASDVSNEVFVKFLSFVEAQLRLANASKIIIKLAPESYDAQRLVVAANFFFTRHYKLMHAEVGAVMPVSDKNFDDIIHPRKKRKLQQSRGHGLRFEVLDLESLSLVYRFIAACRQPKNYELSITSEDLLHTVQRMPQQYPLFAVFYEGEMVAASVTIRAYEHVLYHFISDHVRKIGSLSPALILMEGIYNYCRRENISLLDLGTSTVDGIPNLKLLKFKRELGAEFSHKFTFEKDLE